MVDVCAEAGWFKTSLSVMRLVQGLLQVVLPGARPIPLYLSYAPSIPLLSSLPLLPSPFLPSYMHRNAVVFA
jgi:hypothetical protein